MMRPRHFDLPLTDAADRVRVAIIISVAVALSTAFAAAGIVRVLLAAA